MRSFVYSMTYSVNDDGEKLMSNVSGGWRKSRAKKGNRKTTSEIGKEKLFQWIKFLLTYYTPPLWWEWWCGKLEWFTVGGERIEQRVWRESSHTWRRRGSAMYAISYLPPTSHTLKRHSTPTQYFFFRFSSSIPKLVSIPELSALALLSPSGQPNFCHLFTSTYWFYCSTLLMNIGWLREWQAAEWEGKSRKAKRASLRW